MGGSKRCRSSWVKGIRALRHGWEPSVRSDKRNVPAYCALVGLSDPLGSHMVQDTRFQMEERGA